MSHRIDCERLTGRLRDICRGYDDQGRPVLTVEQRFQYLKLWGHTEEAIQAHFASQEHSLSHDRTGSDGVNTLRHHRRHSLTLGAGNQHKWYSAFRHRCRYFGQHLGDEPCTCGSHITIPLFMCHALSEERRALCVETESAKSRLKDRDLRNRVTACSHCPLYERTPRYVSQKQLASDTLALIGKLPPGITRIAGVARSGLSVATTLAKYLHLPIDIVRQTQGDIVEGGNGWRLKEGSPPSDDAVLVVDDTCMTGNSLKAITPLVQKHYGSQAKYATVYVNPLAKRKPDYWAVDLPHPHVLEWNLFNSVFTPSCGLDFDGILCDDCPPQDDDDGSRYLRFLENVRPRYFVRKRAIPLIVTARLEKYRTPTQLWLKRWGMRCDRLVMGPWETKAERRRGDVAAYKAEHFREFLKRRFHPGPPMFVESDPRQAQRIAELSGGIVVCPAAERCFP